jgi:hypothetical protein
MLDSNFMLNSHSGDLHDHLCTDVTLMQEILKLLARELSALPLCDKGNVKSEMLP